MGITEDDVRAHPHQFVRKKHSGFEHLFVNQDGARALRSGHDRNRGQVRRERRPGSVIDFGHRAESVARHVARAIPVNRKCIPIDTYLDAKSPKAQKRRIEVLDRGVFHHNLAPRNRREAHEGPRFDVVGTHRECGTSQFGHAGDVKLVGTNPLDSATHLIEEMAQILDVRL